MKSVCAELIVKCMNIGLMLARFHMIPHDSNLPFQKKVLPLQVHNFTLSTSL